MTPKQRLIVIIGIAISIIFLAVAFSGLDPVTVWGYIQQANIPLLLVAAAWYFAPILVIALRWQYLLRSTKRVPLSQLFRLVCIAYMGNNVYPLRTGEMLRIVLLQRSDAVPIACSTTTVIVERIFDGIVMLSFVIVSLALLHVASPELRSITLVGTPVFIIALVIFFALALKPNILRRLLMLISRVLPGRLHDLVLKLGEDMIAGLEGLRTPADLAGTVLASYGSWLLAASAYWLVAIAFNLQLDFATVLLTVGVVNLAGLIPASPGQLGVFEAAVVLALAAVGIEKSPATAYALGLHLIVWLPVTLLGFYYLIRRGLGLDAVTHVEALEHEVAAS